MARIFKGDDGLFGIEGDNGGVIYEADFSLDIARRIVQMENTQHPPNDWDETRDILEAEGFQV